MNLQYKNYNDKKEEEVEEYLKSIRHLLCGVGCVQVSSQCILTTVLGARYCRYFTDKEKETRGTQVHVQGHTADQQWN